MSRINLTERIKEGPFLLDGAMGTQLFARGIEVGTCNDYLNIDSPNTIFDIHLSYIKAGSDAVITNTFGANEYVLTRNSLDEEAVEINMAAAQIARRAAGLERYVLGNIGPSGNFLQPLGTLSAGELKNAFAVQAKSLLAGGVDGFIIETMTALDEITVAIEAVKSVCDLPVFASMSFDRAGDDYRTMMGVDVKTAVSKIISLEVDAVGFNCGTVSLDEYVELADKYVSAVKTTGKETAIYAEPNAGKPELVDGRAVYRVLPEEFAAAAEKILSAGINIIGGCCGTAPAHIEALAKNLKNR
ncbi:MAG: homocysteine S-methyltransferase family protein [Planctomycetota bacterium]|jgi:5-methyltetrahydrofolate--homocysteine methyltransferase